MKVPHPHGSFVMILGAAVLVAGAGFAAARTSSGPPWTQQPACDATVDPVCEGVEEEEQANVQEVQADVEEFFGSFEGDCGLEVLGDADLTDEATVEAYEALMTSLESGQTSHMVQGVRSVLENCEDHPNEGLKNALYHHGLNWVRHHEHEQWLQERFESRWPDGKPGGGQGNPHATDATGGPGNGHAEGGSNGNAYGHSK